MQRETVNQIASVDKISEEPLEILVPTVTAIIRSSDNPYEILIGTSDKHPLPVLPGGKIDRADLVSTSILEASNNAVHREIQEETAVTIEKITFFFEWQDRERDVRVVPARNLRESLVGEFLHEKRDDFLVNARYGVPDFVYIVDAKKELLPDSSELRQLSWVDLRKDRESLKLSAGHLEIIHRYLEGLESSFLGC